MRDNITMLMMRKTSDIRTGERFPTITKASPKTRMPASVNFCDKINLTYQEGERKACNQTIRSTVNAVGMSSNHPGLGV
jgi:hypothetical protein